jgi:hypothetical protein
MLSAYRGERFLAKIASQPEAATNSVILLLTGP